MRAAVERLVRRVWLEDGSRSTRIVRLLLTPPSWLWRAAVTAREARFSRREPLRVQGLVVVSVGNVAVGGTGKTPLASWVLRRCGAAGVRTALLSRGYGRDEVLLHARWTPEVPVLVGRDRTALALRARDAGVRVAVLDDGFQHRRLARDLDVVLLALEDPFPGDLLPKGPYREPPTALARADAVVITRRSGTALDARALADRVEREFPGLVRASAYMTGGRWIGLDGAPAVAPAGDVLAAAAVARPASFAATVEAELGRPVQLVTFADHHDFSPADARRLRGRAGSRVLVVTEKDAVKLYALRDVLGPTIVLAQDVAFDWGEDALGLLIDAVMPASSA